MTEGTAMPVICYGLYERKRQAIARGERDERKAKVGCADMFTREGNIPRANRNEKPAAAARQSPAASFREPCTHKR